MQKTETAIRPLACGDPIRRLVSKCFCVAGKDDIDAAFKGRNYGVGCKGGVEVIAHSLRDTLNKHKDSNLALLKIDFKNAFNKIRRDHFVPAACKMFPGMTAWTMWCYDKHYAAVLISGRSRHRVACNRATRWGPCTSAAASTAS